MEDLIIHERYRELACMVIQQAIEDYVNSDIITDDDFYRWVMTCDYFNHLRVDKERIYARAVKIKERYLAECEERKRKGLKKKNYMMHRKGD